MYHYDKLDLKMILRRATEALLHININDKQQINYVFILPARLNAMLHMQLY